MTAIYSKNNFKHLPQENPLKLSEHITVMFDTPQVTTSTGMFEVQFYDGMLDMGNSAILSSLPRRDRGWENLLAFKL